LLCLKRAPSQAPTTEITCFRFYFSENSDMANCLNIFAPTGQIGLGI